MRTNGWRMRETRSYDADRLQLTGIAVAQCTDNSQLCTTPASGRWRRMGAGFGVVPRYRNSPKVRFLQ